MKRRAFLGSAAAATTLLAGCGSGGQPDPDGVGDGETTTTELQISATVTITDDSVFDPIVTEVAVGATVQWVNEDTNFVTHVLKSPARSQSAPETFTESGTSWEFDTTILEGDQVERTFEEPGVYEFFSTRGEPDASDERRGWETICGAIVVGDAELNEALPCEDAGEEGTEGGAQE